METKKEKRNFDWSLNPILLSMKFLAGAPVEITRVASKKSFASNCITTFLGFLILVSNILINGPRALNTNRFFWMKAVENFDSPFTFFRDFPDALLQFVVDVTTIIFFVVVPLIHFVFLVVLILSKQWTDLVLSLKDIETQMKLSEKFHLKCRKKCVVVLLLLFSVIYVKAI